MKQPIIKLIVPLIALSMAVTACVSSGGTDITLSSSCPLTGAKLFVTTTDFTVGGAAVITGDPPNKVCLPATGISSDAAAQVFGPRVYVINRFGFDNIQVLDAQFGYTTMTQVSVGNGSNPQDIAVYKGPKAFVSRLGNSALWIGNPFTLTTLAEIDLSPYADADGNPEAAKMVLVDNRLFVALQMLDPLWSPTAKSSIAVIDTDNNTLVTVIDLATTNPFSRLIYNPGDSKIYVGCSGGFQSWGFPAGDGGVETITIDTVNDVYTPNGIVVGEIALGGDINHLAVVSSTQAYALVSDVTFQNHLVKFNPQTGVVDPPMLSTFNWIADMVLDSSGYLYLADRDFTNPGVQIWDTATDTEIATSPISTGLPPYWLAVVQ